MTFKEHIARFTRALEENPSFEIEEIHELFRETSADDIRASSKLFANLCHILTDALIKTHRSVCGISFISSSIEKLQNHRSQLTSIHSDLCMLCLDSKCFQPAIRFLDIDHTEIKRTDDRDYDTKQVISYYYHGALIYAAVKNFERAACFFEIVLTIPAQVVTPIMHEAYKKLMLMCLLTHGKLPESFLPSYTSSCVIRQRKHVGLSYNKFAQEYTTLNYDKIRKFVEHNSPVYERDENMGLIKQCLVQIHKRNIQRLTKTFLTLPLRDVATHVGLADEKEAELYILNMIDDGEIFATINQKEGMVIFEENPEKYNSTAVFKKLQKDIATSMMLINTLRKLNVEPPQDITKIFSSKVNSADT